MIKRREQIRWLNSQLLGEMPEYRPQAESFPNEHTAQRCLLRSLMNVRAPLPLRQGETLLVPAAARSIRFIPEGEMKLLTSHL